MLVLLFVFAGYGYGQQKIYELNGTVADTRGAVMSGTRLIFSSGKTVIYAAADVNGDFRAGLPSGSYNVTADPAEFYKFAGYIKITDSGPNPDGVVFNIDTSAVCCISKSGAAFPLPLSLPKPPYPPAARAVRATGEVLVAVTINRDGSAGSAAALSGHPLLRAAAAFAARSSRFEPSNADAERTANLTYVFLAYPSEKPGLTRFTNPYRVRVDSPAETIDAVNVRSY